MASIYKYIKEYGGKALSFGGTVLDITTLPVRYTLFYGTILPVLAYKYYDLKQARLDEFSIEAYQKNIKKHINQDTLKGTVLPEFAFNKLMAERVQSIDEFSAIKAPGNKSLSEKLEETGNDNIITNINGLLANSNQLTDAKHTYTTTIAALKNDINTNETNLSAYGIAKNLEELKVSSLQAIDNEAKRAKDELENLFNDPNMPGAFKASHEQVEHIKSQMLQTIDEKASKSKEEFEKSLSETIKSIREEADKQRHFRAAYVMMMNASERNRQNAEAAIKRRHKDKGTMSIITTDTGLNLTGASIEDFGNIMDTLTGGSRGVTVNNGVLNIQMPGWGAPYNWPWLDSRRRSDFKALMIAAKVAKYDKIMITVTHPLASVRAERTREAVIAALESGYPLEKISVVLDGKKIKGNEIREKVFITLDPTGKIVEKDYSAKLDTAIQVGANFMEKIEKMDAPTQSEAVSEYSHRADTPTSGPGA